MKALSVLETSLYVDNLDEAKRFYVDILGLKLNSQEKGRSLMLECGNSMLLLFNANKTRIKTGPVPVHGADGPGHVAFSIGEDDFDDWRERLSKHGVRIESEVDWPHSGHSLYVRDPSGNSVELTTPKIWGI